jgi:hypothetical protein
MPTNSAVHSPVCDLPHRGKMDYVAPLLVRIWRSHPVLFATIIGAIVGLGNALVMEIPALLGRPSKGVLSLLEPASRYHASAGALETALLLLIEIGANILVYAAIFALLGCAYIGICRIFRPRNRSEAKDSAQI